MRMMQAITWAAVGLLTLACASEGGTNSATDTDKTGAANATDSTDQVDSTDPVDNTDDGSTDATSVKDPDTPAGCAYDAEKKGKIVGKHIDNFGALDVAQEAYYLHDNCGDEKKVVWVILATGW